MLSFTKSISIFFVKMSKLKVLLIFSIVLIIISKDLSKRSKRKQPIYIFVQGKYNLLAQKLDSFLNHVGHHKCKISIPSVNVNNKFISIRTQCMWRISMCILQMSTPLPWTYSKLMSLLNKNQTICSWILYFIYLPMDIPWLIIKA
jgi:hypothetical protein